jgi:hypothetical protein
MVSPFYLFIFKKPSIMLQRILNQLRPVQPIEACPNCWGISQWADKDCPRQFDLDKGQASEIFSRNGFIRRFVKEFIG